VIEAAVAPMAESRRRMVVRARNAGEECGYRRREERRERGRQSVSRMGGAGRIVVVAVTAETG
jgi:hypothetical protein